MNRETRELQSARARLLRFVWIVVVSIAAGSIGYAIATGEGLLRGLQMTIETLAYLGKGQKTGTALVVQLALLHFGTLITWYAGWLVVDLAMENHFGRHFSEMRRMKKVSHMEGHAVICGGGRVGARLAETLHARGDEFVVIESDPEVAQSLTGLGYLVVEGDARDDEAQRSARVDRAKRLFSVLPEAEKNIVVVLTARALSAKLEIHARSERADYEPKLKSAGASFVVMPAVACADRLLSGASIEANVEKA